MYHESFQVLIKGLSSEELSFEGKFYRFDRQPMILRPLQRPHPPLWYGVILPDNADWPAENHVNIVALGLRTNTAQVVARYRAAREKRGFDPQGTLMGVSRHVVVAETDEEALRIARRAYPRWRESFRWLFARHGAEPRVVAIYPPTFDELVALDNGIAGSPETVRRFIAAEIEANNCNYFVPQLVFGDMTLPESLRSIELFAREVMPAFSKPV
jgi:alkanesulfonate monooxygenase SsuD/methylene tetrahydromethanopterin reductase-like flavin-dependent oxidoreductase (luciferase family)